LASTATGNSFNASRVIFEESAYVKMKPHRILITLAGLLSMFSTNCEAADFFRDDFKGRLADGWSWVREDKSGWRVTERGLEVRVQPGNMWGPANNATNVLVRSLPDTTNAAIEIAVTIENRPAEQYEQADLVWYYDDSHMVKLGQELVDGKLSIVMGREEKDKTRTMCIIPIQSAVVHARFVVKGNLIRGEYRLGDEKEWRGAGECDLPVNGSPKASLQVYQGPKTVERWARFSAFSIRTADR
jgi:regulation of enolase protein 1 (concanavalin A-like superfamily)